ncbi:MAG: hypothetical protein M3R70_01585 [Actinomycetota bacterium]|nr:hypothetical protein [Actinomycetota bacterium]
MRRWLILSVLLLASLAFAAAGTANGGHGHGKHKKKPKRQTRYTFVMANTDDGSCGQQWATLQEKRTFVVKRNRDGSYRVWRIDRGTFTTTGPVSPGACQTTKPHGTVVTPGKTGRFHGYLVGTVSGGTFDPNATCTTDCGFTDVFISTHFGPSAKYSCLENSADCKFKFQYHARKEQGLALRHWRDAGRGAGTMLNEKFRGDISNDRVS